MKVGTDSILLGSWVAASKAVKTVLDIGTGTGILSLMMAQKLPNAQITGLEFNREACMEAQQNFSNAPWANRLQVKHGDFLEINLQDSFDLLIANPPYFQNSLKAEKQSRTQARHDKTLPLEALISQAYNCMHADSLFYLVYPATDLHKILQVAQKSTLFVHKILYVSPISGKTANRVCLCFGKQHLEMQEQHLAIRDENNLYSLDFKELTKEYYL